ncbi:MAG: Xaa-Pro peptidase family protein [Mariniblastus sp.]|nr:Xaa-Pro peptidase family protein [Mariniblastus sp.]
MEQSNATVMAGIPAINSALYRKVRFNVGDPVALISLNGEEGEKSIFILRDIEMHRARQHAQVDEIACPADYSPADGLSGDRETATAQATAECLARHGITSVVADRTLPLIFAEIIRQRGIEVICDMEFGVTDRRSKDAQEIAWLREAQTATESAMEMACQLIARAEVDGDGSLIHEGTVLTSERVRNAIDVKLLELGYANVPSIVAGGPTGADCHEIGSGPLKTGQPVIVDIFPQNRTTLYNGDCTRTVVHGPVSEQLQQMHAAVYAAKQAGEAAVKPGVTGEDVHKAVIAKIREHGFEVGIPDDTMSDEYCAMVHGTGHGIGLDVHEPPLLDFKGPPLVVGDALTIEPGVYSKAIGGIRIEDMVVVTENGCENLNHLPQGLTWD